MYQWTERDTAIELEIEDESPAAVFREAVVALGDLLTEERGGESMTHIVILSAPDVSALLRAWMEELTRLDESDGFVPERVVKLQLADANLTATVGGQRLDGRSASCQETVSASRRRFFPSSAKRVWQPGLHWGCDRWPPSRRSSRGPSHFRRPAPSWHRARSSISRRSLDCRCSDRHGAVPHNLRTASA